jgi:hypothetical protein
MFRTLPKFSVTTQSLPTDSGGTVALSLNNGDILTTGWRLAASKQLGRFGISGGVRPGDVRRHRRIRCGLACRKPGRE